MMMLQPKFANVEVGRGTQEEPKNLCFGFLQLAEDKARHGWSSGTSFSLSDSGRQEKEKAASN